LPSPVVVPAFVSAVPEAAPAWLLVEPGTTVLPVPPAVLLLRAAPLGAFPRGDCASPVFKPEAAVLSAVPDEAVPDRLLPRLPVGFCCAIALANGNTIKLAARSIERNWEVIFSPSERVAGTSPSSATQAERASIRFGAFCATQHHAESQVTAIDRNGSTTSWRPPSARCRQVSSANRRFFGPPARHGQNIWPRRPASRFLSSSMCCHQMPIPSDAGIARKKQRQDTAYRTCDLLQNTRGASAPGG
jgi:hypothetical protein